MTKTYALIDCNNFFATCEKIFNPSLLTKPVIVLSNNDGCIIARSPEAKDLGIKMGEPYFKVKDYCIEKKIHVFSSNYELYGDISQRVMSILSNFTPNFEVYSIDEAFLELNGFEGEELNSYLEEIAKIVLKWTGISVSIGVGPTKTLAKIANYHAKKNKDIGTNLMPISGICNLMNNDDKELLLSNTAVEEIWGVGKKWGTKLRAIGVANAKQLADAPPKFIRNNFNVIAEKIVYELNGTSCLEMETIQNKKSITASRSFCIAITDLNNLEEAVSDYVSRASLKLREQNSFAGGIYVYLKAHSSDAILLKNTSSLYHGITRTIETPTNSTSTLINIAKKSLACIYQKGVRYKKAGIILLDLVERNLIQENLFYSPINKREQVLLKIMDGINQQKRSNIISFAAAGTKKPWQMKRDFCSNRYTTSWKEIPLVS